MEHLFTRQRLTAGQLRAVGNRRIDDAVYLRNSRQNKYANGAIYLAGIATECFLKAKLLDAYPELARPWQQPQWDAVTLQRYMLLTRWHDLAAIVGHLPDLAQKLVEADPSRRMNSALADVCQWSVFARYSPMTVTMDEAGDFLEKVQELKQWLM